MDSNSREITKYVRFWKCLMNDNLARVSILILLLILARTWKKLKLRMDGFGVGDARHKHKGGGSIYSPKEEVRKLTRKVLQLGDQVVIKCWFRGKFMR